MAMEECEMIMLMTTTTTKEMTDCNGRDKKINTSVFFFLIDEIVYL